MRALLCFLLGVSVCARGDEPPRVDKPLPVALLKKIVKARVAQVEDK